MLLDSKVIYMTIKELQNLNDIGRAEKRGIYKISLYKSNIHYFRASDYMQKINYCIQDLNIELEQLSDLSNKSIVYIITLVTWIREAVKELSNLYKENVCTKFNYSQEEELKKAEKFLSALRSFVVAHPLTTNRHMSYGMNGNLTCIDIKLPCEYLGIVPQKDIAHLDYEGLHESTGKNADFYLYAFSTQIEKKDISIHIGCCMRDIYHIAELYIEKIYELDKHLQKEKSR